MKRRGFLALLAVVGCYRVTGDLPPEVTPEEVRAQRCETCAAWDGKLCRRRAPVFDEHLGGASQYAWWTRKWVPTRTYDWCLEWISKTAPQAEREG